MMKQVILLNNLIWNSGDGYAEILVPGQWCTQVIFFVNAHVIGLGIFKNTITNKIECGGVRSRCAHELREINDIEPNC